MKNHILYLHGLGSSGLSNTVKELRAKGLDVVAPTYRPEQYQESIFFLSKVLAQHHDIQVIVGTSMGGYYALKLAEITSLPVIAINPCFEPLLFFAEFCHYPIMNYVTNQPIDVSNEQIAAFETINSSKIKLPNIVIGRNDSVIPANYQQSYCRQQGWSFVETDWGHRIEDPMIIMKLLNI